MNEYCEYVNKLRTIFARRNYERNYVVYVSCEKLSRFDLDNEKGVQPAIIFLALELSRFRRIHDCPDKALDNVGVVVAMAGHFTAPCCRL